MTEQCVYIVDDDEAMRDSLQWLIESQGLAVRTFAAAEDFLAACGDAMAGCIVLDVRMPGMSGLVLFERHRQPVRPDAAHDGATHPGHGFEGRARSLQIDAGDGCAGVQLDSGVQRFAAHAFYFGRGMRIAAHHFAMALDDHRD